MASAVWWRHIMAVAVVFVAANSGALAGDDGVWSVSQSSGEVWISSAGVEQASLTQEEVLKPGDTIRTGRNGRVLLVRGEETMLISPNSVIGVPAEKKDGMSTTILQQAGSVLLEVEKRNVKHFEVETPYLAAVVKGTKFEVTVNATSTRVEVSRGQVEVSDFRSGQIAQVTPGQAATTFTHGKGGLALSGSGPFSPIEQGKPRASSIHRIPVPKGGLTPPRDAANGKSIHALGHIDPATAKAASRSAGGPSGEHAVGHSASRSGIVHISTSLGEVRLNVQNATHGLAHGSVVPTVGGSRVKESYTTVWSDTKPNSNATASSNSSGASNGAAMAGMSAASGVAATVANAAAAGSTFGNAGSNAGGNPGATGNGKANGESQDHGGNGNGKGNGNAFGLSKH